MNQTILFPTYSTKVGLQKQRAMSCARARAHTQKAMGSEAEKKVRWSQSHHPELWSPSRADYPWIWKLDDRWIWKRQHSLHPQDLQISSNHRSLRKHHSFSLRVQISNLKPQTNFASNSHLKFGIAFVPPLPPFSFQICRTRLNILHLFTFAENLFILLWMCFNKRRECHMDDNQHHLVLECMPTKHSNSKKNAFEGRGRESYHFFLLHFSIPTIH